MSSIHLPPSATFRSAPAKATRRATSLPPGYRLLIGACASVALWVGLVKLLILLF